jgi:hypothetical protein
MAIFLSDAEISKLLSERKILPPDYRMQLKLKSKRGHDERELEISGEEGSKYLLILRLSQISVFDFSVILAYQVPKTNVLFRLRRYNGKSHEHTNKLEGQTFYDYHIHMATERYQQLGLREDSYVEPTNRYSDLDGAIQCVLADCNFDVPPDPQLKLW